MKLIFATNNQNKLQEVRQILWNKFEVLWLKEFGCDDDIPETQDTFKWNASQKSNFFYEKYKINCFADDSGLVVNALDWEPWIYSARYAGPNNDYAKNREKLLENMKWKTDRSAYFITVISLILDGKEYFFEWKVDGKIINENEYNQEEWFGYDPIFIPDGYEKTFGEIPHEVKNSISHRGTAMKQMVEFLSKI